MFKILTRVRPEIKNLTPHPLSLVGENGVLNVPTSGQIARLSVSRDQLYPVTINGVTLEINRPKTGDIQGLPDPKDGVLFVVSAMVADAAKRSDVMSPGELIRNSDGVVIGAKGLCAYK